MSNKKWLISITSTKRHDFLPCNVEAEDSELRNTGNVESRSEATKNKDCTQVYIMKNKVNPRSPKAICPLKKSTIPKEKPFIH